MACAEYTTPSQGGTKHLRTRDRSDAIVLRYNPVKREGKARFRIGIRLHDVLFDGATVGTADWERKSGYLMPATADRRRSNPFKAMIKPERVTKISFGPPQLVEAQRNRTRLTLIGLFLGLEKRIIGQLNIVRSGLFVTFVVLLIASFFWNPWSSIPSGTALLLALLWKWPEYLLFRGR